jgi:hypothetical protein
LRAWIHDVAGCPHTEGTRSSFCIDSGETGVVDLAAERVQKAVRVGDVSGPHEHCRSFDHRPIRDLDAGQLIATNDETRDPTSNDLHATSFELRELG